MFSFWPQKSSIWVRKISGARNWQNGSVSGARNSPKTSVSGPRNRRNVSAKFLEPETDKMVQFLGPETVFYGRVELYLNCRLQKFFEESNILVDEQNGFRAARSCMDHIFALITILRNRKAQNKSTYLCFRERSSITSAHWRGWGVWQKLLMLLMLLGGVGGLRSKLLM